jgi:oxygen-independent coproporphyrinogen III oxidase
MSANLTPFWNRRIPRYTSYPTAVQFGPEVDGLTYSQWLTALPDLPVSVYLHVPFCAELCLYCGCHTTVARKYGPVADYADLLEREIALVGQYLRGRRKAVHVHWGGGTPTMLSPEDFARLTRALRKSFVISPECEIAIEIDPRTLTRELVSALADAGVTRASLGVQDLDEKVQRTVGRIQSFEQTAQAAEWLRAAGIVNINLDLMYGLPYQTSETVAETARRALTLAPDRIALFGYAHVPWMKRHQKLLPEQMLPDVRERHAQSRVVADVLESADFQPIGLDHFARRNDLLARRQREKRLHRNFQGYTTDEAAALIGFGTSSIGALPQGYIQNASSTVAYRNAIRAGRLATARGRVITDDDRLRREIIEQLMCNLEVDLAAVAAARNRTIDDFAHELREIDSLAAHGLVFRSDAKITIPEDARPLVRTICAVFDRYLSAEETRYSRAM